MSSADETCRVSAARLLRSSISASSVQDKCLRACTNCTARGASNLFEHPTPETRDLVFWVRNFSESVDFCSPLSTGGSAFAIHNFGASRTETFTTFGLDWHWILSENQLKLLGDTHDWKT
jgi:hypothetical protein